MPRAKVNPEDRQRSAIACLPCKKAKIRCDSGTPCATCAKRGRQSACQYQESSTRIDAKRRRLSRLSNDDRNKARQSDASFVSNARPTPDSIVDEASSTNEESRGPQSRMLFSSKFQKVYIGETASLSYLQFLRRVVKHRVGPCQFTEGEFNNFMLENEVVGGGIETLDNLSLNAKIALVQSYLDATSGILDFHNKSEMFNALNDSPSDAGIYIALAIGAQCRGSPPSDLQHSAAFFSQGQRLSFDGMLCDPSLEMVRNFLLMAFYMLGACHRNAAFMYLGVAAKAASALGLHRSDQYRHLQADECNIRLSTWKSLRVLDTIVNSILGRSNGLSGASSDPRLSKIEGQFTSNDQARKMALHSTFDICPFMDELEITMSSQTKMSSQDTEDTEKFLQRLQKWSKALPDELRSSTDVNSPISSDTNRELFIGGTHVACVYYFAVILTTRRYFTLHLLDQLHDGSSQNVIPKSKIDDRGSSLAYVCLNAATNLAKVGHNAMISSQMPNNMCLMKAWMFAAGLLLGFSLFAQVVGTGAETEDGFRQACAVLKKLSALSPQAGHYYEILTSLSDAMALFQKVRADERKRLTSQYMDQIFTSNSTGNVEDFSSVTNAGALSTAIGDNEDPSFSGHMDSGNLADYNLATGPYGMSVSEGFPWPADDVPFDWQSIAPFFDDVL